MIDRDARNRLLQGIDDYMDEKISAEEFDDLLFKRIAPHTEDEGIKEISIWLHDFHYIADTIHPRSECPYWKFFNRCRLLLSSDAEYYVESLPRCFNFFRRISMVLLVMWVLVAVGIGGQAGILSSVAMLGVLYFPFGFVMYVLCVPSFFMSEKKAAQKQNVLFAEYPFESFADLLAVRRSVPKFLSKRFPNKPPITAQSQNRLIRFLWDTKCPAWVDRMGDTFVLLIGTAAWMIVLWLPFAVLVQFYSEHERRIRLIIPGVSVTNSPT